jgi:spore coat assembly protein SafA
MSEQNREFQGLGIQFSPTTIPCPNGQLYTVKSGDTLFFIARRYNISLQSLIDANPQITDPNTIFPGQVICVPTGGQGVTCPNGQIYRVVRGDTMYEIARRNGMSLESLIRANPQITNPNLIYPGQEICIPRPQIAVPFAEEPIPLPTPIPEPMPLPQPIPTPVQPILPIPCPTPPVPMPLRPPMPCPGMVREETLPQKMPCPDMRPMAPMPFYIQIPWEECPYRDRRKKKRHSKKRCR